MLIKCTVDRSIYKCANVNWFPWPVRIMSYCTVKGDALGPLLNCITKPIKMKNDDSIPAHFPYCESSTSAAL